MTRMNDQLAVPAGGAKWKGKEKKRNALYRQKEGTGDGRVIQLLRQVEENS